MGAILSSWSCCRQGSVLAAADRLASGRRSGGTRWASAERARRELPLRRIRRDLRPGKVCIGDDLRRVGAGGAPFCFADGKFPDGLRPNNAGEGDADTQHGPRDEAISNRLTASPNALANLVNVAGNLGSQ